MDQLAQRLTQERIRCGLSTFDLAQRTKIREPYIQAIEQGKYNILPAIYVRSFIRTIGSELAVPPNEINRLIRLCLDSDDGPASAATQPQSTSTSSARGSAKQDPADPLTPIIDAVRSLRSGMTIGNLTTDRRRIVVLVGSFLLVVIALWLIFGRSDGNSDPRVPSEIVDISSTVEEDSLILTAMASDTAELTMTMDGTRYQKFIVMPETEYRWSAMKKFTVSNIFNAGAIEFFRDGKPLPRYGKIGEVLRELVITRTEVVASNTSTKMVTAPADPERARRDSIIEQQRRDSIRAVRRKERLQSREVAKKKKPAAKPQKPRQRRVPAEEAPILKTPPRGVR